MRRQKSHSLTEYEREKKRLFFESIAGVDEAGVGSWAGPVVAAAVILRHFNFKSRVYDSKSISPSARIAALREIAGAASIGVGIVHAKMVDSINVYNATRLAMERAVLSLCQRPDYVLVDGRIKPKVDAPLSNIIGGDRKSISIAAASIVAKVARDAIMHGYDLLYPGYGFARHKGYGTERHILALEELGPCLIHRMSFKPVASWIRRRVKSKK